MITNFNNFTLIKERLHIDIDMDVYSDKIYKIIKESNENKFVFFDTPGNINKLTILLTDDIKGYGELNLNNSYDTENGWYIEILLKSDFLLDTLKHELYHALRLTLLNKDKIIKKLNYLKSGNIFSNKKYKNIEFFMYMLYLASDEEINAKIQEFHGHIKEIMNEFNISKLNSEQFKSMLMMSRSYEISNELLNFDIYDNFKNWDENKINKFFYILEDNKKELDKIEDNKWFKKVRLILKSIKDNFKNSYNIDLYSDDYIYKANKDIKYYEKYFKRQGNKLKRKLSKLFDNYI